MVMSMKTNEINNREYEEKLNEENIHFIAGVDEVGRGPLVGPVVAACVVLPKGYVLEGLTDSKKLSIKKRDEFFDIINRDALGVGIGIIDEKIIDEINILEATKLAMKTAINNCKCKIEHVLIDAIKLDINIPFTPIIKGDYKSYTIAAASVIAKVTRDRLCVEQDELYPVYNIKKHKGYPTKEHMDAVRQYGPSPIHRKTFLKFLDNENS